MSKSVCKSRKSSGGSPGASKKGLKNSGKMKKRRKSLLEKSNSSPLSSKTKKSPVKKPITGTPQRLQPSKKSSKTSKSHRTFEGLSGGETSVMKPRPTSITIWKSQQRKMSEKGSKGSPIYSKSSTSLQRITDFPFFKYYLKCPFRKHSPARKHMCPIEKKDLTWGERLELKNKRLKRAAQKQKEKEECAMHYQEEKKKWLFHVVKKDIIRERRRVEKENEKFKMNMNNEQAKTMEYYEFLRKEYIEFMGNIKTQFNDLAKKLFPHWERYEHNFSQVRIPEINYKELQKANEKENAVYLKKLRAELRAKYFSDSKEVMKEVEELRRRRFPDTKLGEEKEKNIECIARDGARKSKVRHFRPVRNKPEEDEFYESLKGNAYHSYKSVQRTKKLLGIHR